MNGIIIHGVRNTIESPRKGRTDYELWTSSSGMEMWDYALQDWTRHFDCHNIEPQHGHLGIKLARGSAWSYYKKVGPERIIYGWETHPEVPAMRVYPLEAVYAAVPEARGRLGQTMDLMMALAVAEGRPHIVLNGVGLVGDDAHPTDHRWQALHKSLLFWIGFCAGRGIKVSFEGHSVFGPLVGVYGQQGFVKEASQSTQKEG